MLCRQRRKGTWRYRADKSGPLLDQGPWLAAVTANWQGLVKSSTNNLQADLTQLIPISLVVTRSELKIGFSLSGTTCVDLGFLIRTPVAFARNPSEIMNDCPLSQHRLLPLNQSTPINRRAITKTASQAAHHAATHVISVSCDATMSCSVCVLSDKAEFRTERVKLIYGILVEGSRCYLSAPSLGTTTFSPPIYIITHYHLNLLLTPDPAYWSRANRSVNC